MILLVLWQPLKPVSLLVISLWGTREHSNHHVLPFSCHWSLETMWIPFYFIFLSSDITYLKEGPWERELRNPPPCVILLDCGRCYWLVLCPSAAASCHLCVLQTSTAAATITVSELRIFPSKIFMKHLCSTKWVMQCRI